MQLWTTTSWLQLGLLALAFVLCSLIGLERQYRQKAAGFRTHVLVGTGSAGFTLVSAFGFAPVLGEDVVLDPSRIAAQIVSGIGFLGAGVIFTREDFVRGLTTAATIWVAAAVGMASGAGMVSLAVGLTFLHLFALVVVGPLALRLPTRDSNRVLRIIYVDGRGVLRRLLAEATTVGFSAFVLGTRRQDGSDLVEVDVRFKGGAPLHQLIPTLHEVDGVRSVHLRRDQDDDEDDAEA
ncbi:MgtC/SapB family protein [Ornithinimicrobium avium]|uniref:MgtC/SapB family protein n=1 Tax=Ornithinimicrobium avium TaxID=2283195 RepID=A0A345NL91_9MICO|nr:MgtC/SapB family protein [Ornithinimicrobium avium]AXH95799.1 MgtC/SapB family protein [Ornithinimicrobium avium]